MTKFEKQVARVIVGLIVVFIIMCAAIYIKVSNSFFEKERGFIRNGDLIYSPSHYSCIRGVMYSNSYELVLLVDRDKNPLKCEIEVMTNEEYFKL